MNGVLVALYLVACQPDLLICRDIPDDGRRWTDIGDCHDSRKSSVTRARKHLPDSLVIMAKCRFLISRDARSPALF
jgi:hypothetical protein